MAPNQTALSATTMSPLTTDATSHNSQSLEHQPCVYSAFSSKRRRISSYLSHDMLISPHLLGVKQLLPSTAHAHRSARRHPTTIPAVIRIYVPGFVIDASSTLPLPCRSRQ
eukprot:scaffold78230_cov61-Attheya_sp.AAC.12